MAGALQALWLVLGGAILPAVVFGAFVRLAMGVSPIYALRCLYLEVTLRLRSALIGYQEAKEEASSNGQGGKAKHSRTSASTAPPALTEEQRKAPLRGVSVPTAAEYCARGQTVPPGKRISSLFPGEKFPPGEELSYSSSSCCSQRRGKGEEEEEEEKDEAWQHRARCLREGAEVHRQVRQFVQQKVRPGMELREIAEMVEKASSGLVGFDPKNPLRRGWAFPTGLSLNEVAAHDTVNPGDPPRWLKPTDLVKLDFGVHVEGHILDCAFSFTFDSMHDELMQAVKDATNEGIRQAGPDALVSEVGGCIREVMEAGEVHRPDGRVLPVYSIKNLTGHSIAPYRIHAGKGLPSVNIGGSVRMLAGELWAVETFGSAGGVGYVINGDNCSHYMRPSSSPPNRILGAQLSASAKALLELIDRRFGTLAFCPRWVVQEAALCKSPLLRGSGGAKEAQRWWASPLRELCGIGVVNSYPPLKDLPGSYTAQYEHTLLLREKGKEVLTRGNDY